MVFMSLAIFSHRALVLTSNRLFALESRIATMEKGFERDLVLYLLSCSCNVHGGPEDGPRDRSLIPSLRKQSCVLQ